MKSALKVELKRAFCSWTFLFSIMFGSVLGIMAFFNTAGWKLSQYWIRYASGEAEAVSMAAKMGFVDTPLEIWMPRYGAGSKFYYLWITILPLLCVLPYGVTYLQDKKQGLINQLIYRMNKKNYYLSKLLTCFVNGGTIAVFPLIINLLLCMCFLPWGMPIRSTNVYPVGESNAFSDIFYTSPFLYVVIYLILTFVLFGLITSLCMIFALLVESQFALMLAPFVFYFAEHVLLSFGLNRSEWSLMSNANLYNVYSKTLLIYFIELMTLFLLNLCILIKVKRDVL